MDNLSPSYQTMAMGSPFSDDPFFFSALLNFDSFPDQFLSNELGAHQVFANWSQIASPASNRGDNISPFGPSADPNVADENPVQCNSMVPKPVPGASLAERMLRALSLFKESSYSGILAQVWIPVKQGDNYVLTTSDQPFLLDQVLAGYREISRGFIFPAKEGLPGRVFTSCMPEWTTNVEYYREQEFVRKKHAITHEVHGSMGLPVFDPSEGSCVAVLELVTKREKTDFDAEMNSVCNALQAVNLSTTNPQTFRHQQSLTKSQKLAFAEILDVLRAICHAHMLPLALTWVPTRKPTNIPGPQSKTVLEIHEPACYASDPHMQEFLHACAEHMLEPAQGIAGKALESNVPFFSSDVREYTIRDYPLAHHARKSNLRAAVAVRLRSGFTGNDDYVLEFFLPVNCRGCEEQQLLLNNLSGTMQRMCRSLRTVSEAELSTINKAGHCDVKEVLGHSDGTDTDAGGEEFTNFSFDEAEEMHNEKTQSSSTRSMERKRSTSEKNISLSVLQRYFSGSLKDAAKSLGVCPTTLKRICRLHGIARWPSRKINKVNRSLKKIQHVINSVQGVEGGAFKYDPATGCLVTGPEHDKPTVPLSVPKLEQPDYIPPSGHPKKPKDQSPTENLNLDCSGGTRDQSHLVSSSMTDSSSGSASSHPTFKKKPDCEKPMSVDVNGAVPFVTVKATYKEDTVRFKFGPSLGYAKLSEEIEKRFKLLSGTFQIKYKDDEEEWVNLSNDLDLRECADVMDSIGSRNVKILVRETPLCVIRGSSASSSCLVMES
ncbi:Plant regulator RWP-RK family protein [Rhynchospora pubera]|uniref:Plant regulator RWP-RK family protein n=1 Tax=Rhynchospora pubera TaxID=906938 RepID=A0AAV8CMP8_9POAL|nr:Plant regulator RWP-RK family protein [Rhynchospora pubera]